MKIFLTVDFSEASYHSVDYFKALAKEWEADTSFVLIHSYQSLAPYPMTTGTIDPQNPGIPIIEDQELLKQLRGKFDELANELKKHVNVSAQYFEIGSLPSVIKQLVEKESPDLIVMGTREKNALERMSVGTNTLEVVSKTSIPVLAVPKEAKIVPCNLLAFGLDIDDENTKAHGIDFLKMWTKLNDSNLEVLNVSEQGDQEALKQRIENSKTHQELTDVPHEHHVQVHENVYEGISEHVNEVKPNVMALVAGERSFWDRIFHKTKTEKLTHHLQIPVLLL